MRPATLAAAAVAVALAAAWLLSRRDDDDDEVETSEPCGICFERDEDYSDDRTGPFQMCYQCGRMICSMCKHKMQRVHYQKQLAASQNGQPPRPLECPFCREPLQDETPRYLLLKSLLERRPAGRHAKHALFELGIMRHIGFFCSADDAEAVALFRRAAALGSGQAMRGAGADTVDGSQGRRRFLRAHRPKGRVAVPPRVPRR